MVVEWLAPGMEHGEAADLRPEMLRVPATSGASAPRPERGSQTAPVGFGGEWAEGMREGKHHMDVGDVEPLSVASREPGRLGARPGHLGQCRLPQEL